MTDIDIKIESDALAARLRKIMHDQAALLTTILRGVQRGWETNGYAVIEHDGAGVTARVSESGVGITWPCSVGPMGMGTVIMPPGTPLGVVADLMVSLVTEQRRRLQLVDAEEPPVDTLDPDEIERRRMLARVLRDLGGEPLPAEDLPPVTAELAELPEGAEGRAAARGDAGRLVGMARAVRVGDTPAS